MAFCPFARVGDKNPANIRRSSFFIIILFKLVIITVYCYAKIVKMREIESPFCTLFDELPEIKDELKGQERKMRKRFG
jgi:hypothetical protein